MAEYPASWMQHEGDCKDLGGNLVAFETRAEMDCVIQYMEDKFPVSTYPFNWAIGLASSYRYKGKGLFRHDVTVRVFLCSEHSQSILAKCRYNVLRQRRTFNLVCLSPGVYHWHPNDTTMTFDNWAVGSPSGAECVSLSLASPHFGMWLDVGCRGEDEAALLMAVCEREA